MTPYLFESWRKRRALQIPHGKPERPRLRLERMPPPKRSIVARVVGWLMSVLSPFGPEQ